MVAFTEILWLVILGVVVSPLNPLFWGLYFVLAMVLGVITTIATFLVLLVGTILGVIVTLLGSLVLALLTVVPLVLLAVLAILVVTAPFYGIFIIGDVIFTLVFVLTPSWLFVAASFLFWISPPGIVTAIIWIIVVFYVSYSYNGWNDTKDD